MPRANRYHIPGCVWHITHRCHKQEFLLKFERDRKRWRHWLYEAKKRYGLCVLNYIVTSNHIHLLVVDTKEDVIPQSMQLIAGRTGQEYNQRKKRKGAFWEDRYHATAVETDKHLARCLVYIDLNMVRAGVVKHPSEYGLSGFNEIQRPPSRYTVIDRSALLDLFAVTNEERFVEEHHYWVEEQLLEDGLRRKELWSESIAVGSEGFVEKIQQQLGARAVGRSVVVEDEGCTLKEAQVPYSSIFEGEMGPLSPKNSHLWDLNIELSV